MIDISRAVQVVQSGGVIAYPTEAVWGLGCDPWNEAAVTKLLAIKQRSVAKGVILIGASEAQFEPLLATLTEEQRAQLTATWPGAVTWLIPDPNGWAPAWVRGSHDSVAIRVTAHPLVQQLCDQLDSPLVSTSANFAGEPSLLTQISVTEAFEQQIDGVLAGETSGNPSPSQIRDLRTGDVIRPA